MIDLYIADASVWVLTHAGWIFAVGAAYLLGAFASPSARDLRRMRVQRDQALRDAEHTRAEAKALLHRAEWERDRREEVEERLMTVDDVLRCAEMELHWGEER